MTPLQKIAMGLVIVVLTASFAGWDALPNPVGWLLVLSGVRDTRGHLADATALMVLGGIALVASVATYPPMVGAQLEPAARWLVDLPQVAFEIALCRSLVSLLGTARGRWFRWLGWLLVAVAVGPAVAIGADESSIADGVLAAWVVAQVVLIWRLFAVATLPETGAATRRKRPRSREAG